MAIVEIGRTQRISIPTLRLTNGSPFEGAVKISDSETLIVELDDGQSGRVPQKIDQKYMLAWEKDGQQRSCPFLVRSHSGRELVGQLIVAERREAPRLHIEMDLRYEVVPAVDVAEAAEQVMARVNTAEESGSQSLQMLKAGDDPLEMMRQEIQSLREIIQELSLRMEDFAAAVRGEAPLAGQHGMLRPVSVIDISSLGIGFIASSPLAAADTLRIELRLRATPAIQIECMGCVVRCAPLDPAPGHEGPVQYDVGVKFTHIHESDRERLIHHLFKVQRRLLRDRKEARESESAAPEL